MNFGTLLFSDQKPRDDERPQPASFHDLFLDQIVAAAIRGREEYDLARFFYRPLDRVEDIGFRQAIVTDLERPPLRAAIDRFALAMRRMRDMLALSEKRRHPLQKQACLLEAADAWCEGLVQLAADLDADPPDAPGLRLWRDALALLLSADSFGRLRDDAARIAVDLHAIRFTVLVEGLHVRIEPFAGETDYGARISDYYARFDQGGTAAFSFPETGSAELNMIEEHILVEVSRAFPEPFAALADFAGRISADFGDPLVARFDREVQFYLAYLDLIAPLRAAGLAFCLPVVDPSRHVSVSGGFDLALAHGLPDAGARIVPNDFRLEGRERIIVVSGPNQGGKTTFARMVGQLHYLACLGLPVPASSARLHLFDSIFTHFERHEIAASPHGKLEDELVRLHAILDAATGESIVIMNELFASTTFRDASALSEKVTARFVELDLICVWVSFLDGLADMSDTMVSMVSQVDPDNPATRTFRLERRAADGLAYARSIAAKYRLTPSQLEERLTP